MRAYNSEPLNQAQVCYAPDPAPEYQPKKTAPQYLELSFRTRHPRLFCNEHFTSSSSQESLVRKGLGRKVTFLGSRHETTISMLDL